MSHNEELETKAAEETAEEITAVEPEASAEAEVSSDVPEKAEDITDATVEAADESVNDSELAESDECAPAEDQPKKKKPFILQAPVIISCGIVILALIGYFVFSAFFFHTPKGAIWMTESNGSKYFFEFSEDGTVTTTRGTIDETIPYSLTTVDGNDMLVFHYPDGDSQLIYSITGARILSNQEMTLTNEAGTYSTVLTQVKEVENPLELPADFEADRALLGEWYLSFNGTVITVTFNDDGSMCYRTENSIYNYSQSYHGTYTVDKGQVSFTYCSTEPVVELLDYQVSGDSLYFLNMPFTRAGSDSTPDEQ